MWLAGVAMGAGGWLGVGLAPPVKQVATGGQAGRLPGVLVVGWLLHRVQGGCGLWCWVRCDWGCWWCWWLSAVCLVAGVLATSATPLAGGCTPKKIISCCFCWGF